MNKIKCTSLLILAVITVITCINPIYPHEQYLQHAGTVLLMMPLLLDIVKNRMTNLTFVCTVLFTLLHVVGARYIYSYVPYKEWSIAAGIVNADFFQDTRNHYDRFVHFSFGLLMFPFFMYLCKEWFKLKNLTAILMSWLIVQTGSMIYELFEWLLTIVMTSEEADYYNGQQGDMWDLYIRALSTVPSDRVTCTASCVASKALKTGTLAPEAMLPTSFHAPS